MDLDGPSVEALRARGSLKWSLYPEALGAFVAEMDVGTAPAVTRALHAALDHGTLGYLPPQLAADMALAYAQWALERYGWAVPPADVRPIADVLVGLEVAMELFSRPGSAVVLLTPAYMPFFEVVRAAGRQVVEVPMATDGERPVPDLDALDAALGAGGLLVLCNPHNPVGRVLETGELLAISEVVERHGARVFADEIHAPLVLPGAEHVPYASLSPVTAGHTVTATSASKAFDLPGLKCAQLVLSNDPDRETWARAGALAERGASTLGVVAATAAYRAGGPWLDELIVALDGQRRLLAELVAEHLPGVRHAPPEGTYLGWLDCRTLELADPAAFFLERAGVALTDGARCGRAGQGCVRLTLATPRPVLVSMLTRMGAALAAR